jgi:hypothetical protein
MITTSDQTVADDTQHRLEMLLWQARIHEENGKKQEASKIRQWVAGFLSSQPKIGLAPVAQTKPSHARRDPLERCSTSKCSLKGTFSARDGNTS